MHGMLIWTSSNPAENDNFDILPYLDTYIHKYSCTNTYVIWRCSTAYFKQKQ